MGPQGEAPGWGGLGWTLDMQLFPLASVMGHTLPHTAPVSSSAWGPGGEPAAPGFPG